MKKLILFVIAIGMIAITSCTKEEVPTTVYTIKVKYVVKITNDWCGEATVSYIDENGEIKHETIYSQYWEKTIEIPYAKVLTTGLGYETENISCGGLSITINDMDAILVRGGNSPGHGYPLTKARYYP